MELEDIRKLILLMKENEVAEIHLEREGEKVSLVFQPTAPPAPPVMQMAPQPMQMLPQSAMQMTPIQATAVPHPVPEPKEEGVTINSPIVGTFYRSPSPDNPAYIDVGDVFDAETVLCIVEAMKVMNEIKAEMAGTILEILVENGHPVEFGQPLFRIQRTA